MNDPTSTGAALTTRLPRIVACLSVVLALLCASAGPAMASPVAGQSASASRSHSGKAHGKRHLSAKARRAHRRAVRRRRARARRSRLRHTRRADHSLGVSRNAAVSRPKASAAASASGVLDAGFEDGLDNWNTAGVGEAMPTVVNDTVRSGAWSCKAVLTGSQGRSELILGGNGGGSTDGMVEFHEGDEYFYAFSFNIESMVYGEPGAHNLIMQFKGDDEGSPNFGLQLWDYEGDDGEYADNPKGLWSHGPAMGGDRFLAPVAEHQWHDVVIHFKASAVDAGYYELFLDGQLIDSRGGVSMIAPGASYAYIKNGIYRNGDEIPGTSELGLDAVKLGPTWDSVQPG